MRSQVGVRMPDDLRAELEASAKRRGRGISDELIGRLVASFSREREDKLDPTTRALNFLFSKLAWEAHRDFREKWHQNPFIFRAFKLAVAKLLDALEPSGEMQSPFEERFERFPYKTPETLAQAAVDLTLSSLFFSSAALPDHWPAVRHWAKQQQASDPSLPYRAWLDDSERERFGFAAARNALQLTPKSHKKGG
jgi:hypothetical protein